jgi:hypothetical protein
MAVVLGLVVYRGIVHPGVPWQEFLGAFWLRSILYAVVWISSLVLHGAYRPRADWTVAAELWSVVRSTLWLSLAGVLALLLVGEGSNWGLLSLFMLQGVLAIVVRAVSRAAGSTWRYLSPAVRGVVVTTASLVLGAAVWDRISLPYENPHGIVGVLSSAGFNPTTNTLRFLIFVLLPSAAWLVLMRRRPTQGDERESQSWYSGSSRWARRAIVVIACMGLLVALGSLVQGLLGTMATGSLDFFHEGDALAPTSNWVADGRLWTGNAITRGAGHDVFVTWLGWQLFGHESIGAYRAFYGLLAGAVPLALWLFAIVLQSAVAGFASPLLRALLLALTLSLLYLVSDNLASFLVRTIPIVLSLAALILGFANGRAAWYALAGALGLAALLFSSESGIYVLGASLVTLVAFSPGPDWRANLRREVLPWLIGALAAALALLVVVGWGEMQAWVGQIISAATRWDFVYAFVYPTPDPASPLNGHTWPVVLLALLVLGLATLVPAYLRDSSLRTQGQVHLTLVAVAVLSYRTALGRSDAGHVEVGIGMTTFAASFTLWLLLRRASPQYIRDVVLPLSVVPLAVGAASYTLGPILADGASVWSRIRAYADQPDESFLSPEAVGARLGLASAVGSTGCLFVFPNEPAWYYLLGRRTCGPNFFTLHIMGSDVESETIDLLATEPPQYILYDSPTDQEVDGISNRTRLPRLNDWILAEYVPSADVNGWVLLEHRESSDGASRR